LNETTLKEELFLSGLKNDLMMMMMNDDDDDDDDDYVHLKAD